jgi:hypothetical protein
MSALGIALLLGLGSGAWIYSRIYNRTGGNTTSSLVTAGICGAAIALVVFILLSFIG